MKIYKKSVQIPPRYVLVTLLLSKWSLYSGYFVIESLSLMKLQVF